MRKDTYPLGESPGNLSLLLKLVLDKLLKSDNVFSQVLKGLTSDQLKTELERLKKNKKLAALVEEIVLKIISAKTVEPLIDNLLSKEEWILDSIAEYIIINQHKDYVYIIDNWYARRGADFGIDLLYIGNLVIENRSFTAFYKFKIIDPIKNVVEFEELIIPLDMIPGTEVDVDKLVNENWVGEIDNQTSYIFKSKNNDIAVVRYLPEYSQLIRYSNGEALNISETPAKYVPFLNIISKLIDLVVNIELVPLPEVDLPESIENKLNEKKSEKLNEVKSKYIKQLEKELEDEIEKISNSISEITEEVQKQIDQIKLKYQKQIEKIENQIEVNLIYEKILTEMKPVSEPSQLPVEIEREQKNLKIVEIIHDIFNPLKIIAKPWVVLKTKEYTRLKQKLREKINMKQLALIGITIAGFLIYLLYESSKYVLPALI